MNIHDEIGVLGQRYKNYRKALHISQQQIHKKTGVSLFTISAFENGKGQGMSLYHLLSLLNAVELESSFIDLIPDIPTIDPEKMWKLRK